MRIVLTLDGWPLFDSEEELPRTISQALAALFCAMTDDEQAQFFQAVGQVLKTWSGPTRDRQSYAIGKHMQTCACINETGRKFLLSIADALKGEATP